MSTQETRHLVLGTSVNDMAAGRVAIACAPTNDPVPYDRDQHTFLTPLTTCLNCKAVHAAWHVVFVASLG